MADDVLPALPRPADLAALQAYVDDLERRKGWRDADSVRCCFLLGEEIGELFAAVRRVERDGPGDGRQQALGDELVDCLNYLLAIATREGIDLEDAFRRKNARNEGRTWPEDGR